MLETAHGMKVSVNLLTSMVLKSHSLEVALGFARQLCSFELKCQPAVDVHTNAGLVYKA